MDDPTVGRVYRAVRLRLGWRQRDVGHKTGMSQQAVSDIECGRFERVSLARARRVGRALGISLHLAPRWRGPELDRLLDAEHAALAGLVVGHLRRNGWEALVEWSFSQFGERGAADVIGWHAGTRALVVVEVKTRIVDLQDTLSSLDRKVRLARELLARERGWRAEVVGRVLVVAKTSASHARVATHRSLFDAVLPAGSRAVKRWLATPDGPLAGIWFVRNTAAGGRLHESSRVRVRAKRASAG